MNATELLLFLVVFSLFLFGAASVLGTVSDDYVGTLVYSYEVELNDTAVNDSGVCLNFTLDRISEKELAHLDIAYVGGNASDRVYVNSNLVGNLSPASPDAINVNPEYLDVDTCVDFDFWNDTSDNTNISEVNITFYHYDGCNYGEEACDAMSEEEELGGGILGALPYAVLLGFGVFLLKVAGGLG